VPGNENSSSPKESHCRISARAKELIAEEMALCDIRNRARLHRTKADRM